MGMDVIIEGIKSSDSLKFQEYLKVRKACMDADLKEPEEVTKFFDGGDAVPDGITIDIDKAISAYPFEEFEAPNWRIDLQEIPGDIRYLFVWISY